MADFYFIAYIGCVIIGFVIGGVAGFIECRVSKRKKGNRNGSKVHNSKM